MKCVITVHVKLLQTFSLLSLKKIKKHDILILLTSTCITETIKEKRHNKNKWRFESTEVLFTLMLLTSVFFCNFFEVFTSTYFLFALKCKILVLALFNCVICYRTSWEVQETIILPLWFLKAVGMFLRMARTIRWRWWKMVGLGLSLTYKCYLLPHPAVNTLGVICSVNIAEE